MITLTRRFLAVAAVLISGLLIAPSLATAAGGADWTAATVPDAASSKYFASVAYGEGIYAAVSSSNGLMTSTDGINWTVPSNIPSGNWSSVTYGYGNGVFVAVGGNGGTYRAMKSDDGITWTGTSALDTINYDAVTYGHGKFVATGETSSDNTGVAYSTDGTNWTTSGITNPAGFWHGVTYGDNGFVAVASNIATTRWMTSSDGVTWASGTGSNPIPSGTDWQSVTYGGQEGDLKYVAVGGKNGNPNIATSADGVNWTSETVGSSSNYLMDVIYDPYANQYLVVGQAGTVLTSPNAATSSWTTHLGVGSSKVWRGIAAGPYVYAAVGQPGIAMYSYIYDAPTVTAISPASGPTAGGTPVQITGTGFLPNATATIGGTACTSPQTVDSNTLTCTTAAGTAGGASVIVTNPDTQSGTDPDSSAFTYFDPITQTITWNAPQLVSLDSQTLALSATASSGLAVAFNSSTDAVCSVSGQIVTLKNTGDCTITASQAGDGTYLPATDVVHTIKVESIPPVIADKCPTGSCAGVDLSNVDLHNTDLSGIDFSGADLSGADLSGANLSGANLTAANLSAADLADANLANADLARANLSNANLSGADLTGADLRCATTTFSNFSNAHMRRVNLTCPADQSLATRGDVTRYVAPDSYRANFTSADLTNAKLSGANLRATKFAGARLVNADLHKADLRRSNLKNANANRANLRNAQLQRSNLVGVSLHGAKLAGANLNHAAR